MKSFLSKSSYSRSAGKENKTKKNSCKWWIVTTGILASIIGLMFFKNSETPASQTTQPVSDIDFTPLKEITHKTTRKNELQSRLNMKKFYVNRNAQSNGDHEVHELRCSHLPMPDNRKYLGAFMSCREAIREAKKHYINANGCYFCSRPCHTH